jgi:hypothetical protein
MAATNQNGTEPAGWLTAQRLKAAMLVAEDELSDEQIIADVGVASRVTLWRWKENPAFQGAVAEHRIRLEASMSRFSVAKRRKRVEYLQALFDRQWSIMEQRADEAPQRLPENVSWGPGSNKPKYVAGMDTGLITHDVKSVGYGPDQELVDVYKVDTALSAEIRNTLKQAAQEVGQWTEKQEISKDGEELTQVLFVMPQKGSNPPVYAPKGAEQDGDSE